MKDPIARLEFFHGHLSELVLRAGRLVRAGALSPTTLSSDRRMELVAVLETLREELLTHFADEEEGLFPFVRLALPGKSAAVDALEKSHDSICGSVVRLAHLAQRGATGEHVALFDRFELAYAEHSRDEATLLEELQGTLDDQRRGELADLLRGVSAR
jgi:iron-sulfur cluster repair protein YtfE (RIC family)